VQVRLLVLYCFVIVANVLVGTSEEAVGFAKVAMRISRLQICHFTMSWMTYCKKCSASCEPKNSESNLVLLSDLSSS
jgi:hypothetical protein